VQPRASVQGDNGERIFLEPPKVHAEIEIDSELFPIELLQKMIGGGERVRALRIKLPSAYILTSTMESAEQRMVVTLELEGYEIEVEEA
jgi:hypothetical protein